MKMKSIKSLSEVDENENESKTAKFGKEKSTIVDMSQAAINDSMKSERKF
jgi:hypothetical protein